MEVLNASETLLYYLCFDIGIGFVPLKKGYALDHRWAKGVYRAAREDHKVYTRLLEVASENLLYGRALPPQLKIFVGEVISGNFPVPSKKGPAITRDQLRNLCISECMMLLCDELGFQIKSEAKKPALEARVLVCEAFSNVEFKVPGMAKPTFSAVERVWLSKEREQARYDVKMLRWLENHGKNNRWYKYVRNMYWINKYL
ncbi:hypothetical protein MWU61_01670 [Loktanella sp. F6476L]|uniref:hypothetical protein n=1 Tax=Loktanella sp. F6476L TaxID=2926405 RepID=UPI001FF340B3|nr:hypothetical protein [Loktanella sp. F6476L]MCK0119232.1 hypothetical protein [Loktanella sp. F6476L]